MQECTGRSIIRLGRSDDVKGCGDEVRDEGGMDLRVLLGLTPVYSVVFMGFEGDR